jgi:hypothetical protein
VSFSSGVTRVNVKRDLSGTFSSDALQVVRSGGGSGTAFAQVRAVTMAGGDSACAAWAASLLPSGFQPAAIDATQAGSSALSWRAGQSTSTTVAIGALHTCVACSPDSIGFSRALARSPVHEPTTLVAGALVGHSVAVSQDASTAFLLVLDATYNAARDDVLNYVVVTVSVRARQGGCIATAPSTTARVMTQSCVVCCFCAGAAA